MAFTWEGGGERRRGEEENEGGGRQEGRREEGGEGGERGQTVRGKNIHYTVNVIGDIRGRYLETVRLRSLENDGT